MPESRRTRPAHERARGARAPEVPCDGDAQRVPPLRAFRRRERQALVAVEQPGGVRRPAARPRAEPDVVRDVRVGERLLFEERQEGRPGRAHPLLGVAARPSRSRRGRGGAPRASGRDRTRSRSRSSCRPRRRPPARRRATRSAPRAASPATSAGIRASARSALAPHALRRRVREKEEQAVVQPDQELRIARERRAEAAPSVPPCGRRSPAGRADRGGARTRRRGWARRRHGSRFAPVRLRSRGSGRRRASRSREENDETIPASRPRVPSGRHSPPPRCSADDSRPGRDPSQPIDEAYTKKIREYTTEPFFLSPLVDYLPAAPGIPTPQSVLGDVAGAPGKLPHSAEVYRYFHDLAAASPRVRVRTIGKTEEGRDMIVVTVASEALLAKLDENRDRLAKLADPRTIGLDDAAAEKLVAPSVPVYYITGTIHSPETGAPTALMELAYRLAVDESPYIRFIREHVVDDDHADRRGGRPRPDGRRLRLAPREPGPELAAARLLGALRRARQQPRRDGNDAGAHAQRPRDLPRREGAGAPRPARVGALPLRQHGGRRPLQRLARPDRHQRVADVRLEQRPGDDAVRDARRLHARQLRHVVARAT